MRRRGSRKSFKIEKDIENTGFFYMQPGVFIVAV